MSTTPKQIADLTSAHTKAHVDLLNFSNSLDERISLKEQEVDNYISSARGEQSHFRLTQNQVLLSNGNSGSEFPNLWSGGLVKEATLIENVSTGVPANQRSALAREFLQAIGSDYQHFASSFNIWELEYYPNRRGDQINAYAYLMYQYIKLPCYMTIAAIVKHIRGIVPHGFWCEGLEANQPAKLCGQHISTQRNAYTHIHPYVAGEGRPETETGVIQVALPAAVTGHVDLTKNHWGQFPYLGNTDYHAFD